MLETASLHDWSSLLLLETAFDPAAATASISSELFLASAGLHEAETVVLQKRSSLKKLPALTIMTHLDIAFLPPDLPPSDKRRRCFFPPAALWPAGAGCRRPGEDAGGGSLEEVPTNMISPLGPCYLATFTHTWKTSTACKREGEGGSRPTFNYER